MHQKGFSAILVAIMVVAVILLGGLVWYRYTKQGITEDSSATGSLSPSTSSQNAYKQLYGDSSFSDIPFNFTYPSDWMGATISDGVRFENTSGTALVVDAINLKKALGVQSVTVAETNTLLQSLFTSETNGNIPTPTSINGISVYRTNWNSGSENLDQSIIISDDVLYSFDFNADTVSSSTVMGVLQSLTFSTPSATFLSAIGPYGSQYQTTQSLETPCANPYTCIEPSAIAVNSCGASTINVIKKNPDPTQTAVSRYTQIYCLGGSRENNDTSSEIKFTLAGTIFMPPLGSGSTTISVQAQYSGDQSCLAPGDYYCSVEEETSFDNGVDWTDTSNNSLSFTLRVQQ